MRLKKLFVEHESKALLLLTAITLLLRAIVAFYIYSERGTTNWDDDHYYLFVGEQIAVGNWSPHWSARTEIIVGPTLPLLIAFFKILLNEPIIPVIIYNIIVTTLMVLVLFFLGKEIFDRKLGWVMAIWGVFYIEAFKYLPHLLKESTLFLFLPLTILLLIKSSRSSKPFKLLILAGLSYSWLIHTDERFIIYVPLFAGMLFIASTDKLWKKSLQRALLWLTVLFLTMVPWTIHNYKVHNQLVILTPRTTAFTSKLWGENLDRAASHFNDDNVRRAIIENRRERAEQFGELYGKTPYEYGKWETKLKAFQHFWQPTYFRLHFIQYGFRTEKWSLRHNAASLIFYGAFLPFYVAGLVMLFRKKATLALLIALIPIMHSLMHAWMVWPLERYRSPIVFIIVMIGARMAIELENRFTERKLLNKY